MSAEAMSDLEREFRNAARRASRAGNRDKAEAYRYAAYRLREALKEERG